jgi:hypothetical protein
MNALNASTAIGMFAHLLCAAAVGGQGYVVKGTVRDSVGKTISGAYIWPMFESRGVVTKRDGTFGIKMPPAGINTLLVRRCENQPPQRIRLVWNSSLHVLERDVVLPVVADCSPGRAPWSVDARDTVSFRGYYVYSWEGGGWLESCDGRSFEVDWDSPLGDKLRSRQKREGQKTFIQLRGRVAGYGRGTFTESVFLVRKVSSIHSPRSDDCR